MCGETEVAVLEKKQGFKKTFQPFFSSSYEKNMYVRLSFFVFIRSAFRGRGTL